MKPIVIPTQHPKPLPKVFTYEQYEKYQKQLSQYQQEKYYKQLIMPNGVSQ